MTPEFVIVDDLITVEAMPTVSYLIRRRVDNSSLTARYGWVANMVETAPGECEVKGYLAREGFEIVRDERKALERIAEQLEFKLGRYERRDVAGQLKTEHVIRSKA